MTNNRPTSREHSGVGLRQLFTTLFGAIVGVGWISATGLWIVDAGPLGAVIAFALGAVAMTFIGLCFAELMGIYPDASGSPAYMFETFGERPAALAGWFLVLAYSATSAWFFVTLSWLFEAVWPQMRGAPLYVAFGGQVYSGQVIVGVAGTMLSAFVVIRGVSIRQQFLDALVAFMILVGMLMAASALWGGSSQNLAPLLRPGVDHSGIIAVAIMAPFFYAGFDVLPQVLRDRGGSADLTRVGIVFIAGICAAFLFYTIVILSTASILDRTTLALLPLPTFDAFNSGLNQPLMGWAVILAGGAGILTGWVAFLFSGARILHSLARAGAVPAYFATPEKAPSTPRTVAAVAGVGTLIGLSGRSAVNSIVELASVLLMIVFIGVCVAVVKLRKERPDAVRPYRMPFGRLGPFIGIGCGLGLLLLSLRPLLAAGVMPISWIVIGVWSALGILFWGLARDRRNGLPLQLRRRIIVESGV